MKKFKKWLGGFRKKGSVFEALFQKIHDKYSGPLEKPIALANRFSLVLHAAASWVIYFIMEAVSRHSAGEAWTYMTESTAVFAYNSFMIFMSFMLVYLVRRRIFMRLLTAFFWLVLGIINGTILSSRVTPFTGQDLHLITDALDVVNSYMSPLQLILKVGGGCSGNFYSSAPLAVCAEVPEENPLSFEYRGPGSGDWPVCRNNAALPGAESPLYVFWKYCLCL